MLNAKIKRDETEENSQIEPFRVILLSVIRIPIKIINNMDRINDSNDVLLLLMLLPSPSSSHRQTD